MGMLPVAAGATLGSLMGQVGDTLDRPRRFVWNDVLGLPETGAGLLSQQFGMDEESPLTQALGMGAEMVGDPLNLFGAGLGKLASSKLGRTAGTIAGEMAGDIPGMFRGAAPAAVGDVLGSPAARSGIVDTSWMWDRPSGAPAPLDLLNDIRQDAAGAGLGAKQGLRQAQDDIWRDYLGNNINSRRINPDGYVELEARMQELRNEHGLRNLFGAGAHGLTDDAAGQYGEIYRHAQGAGDELRNAQGYRIGDLIGQVRSPLRGALMGDSGLATRGARYNLNSFDYAPGQNPDLARAQPTPRGLDRILEAMPGEGYAVTPGAVSRAKRRAMEAAPEDIGRLLASFDAPSGTLMDQLRGLFDIGDPSLWLGANHQALYDAKYPQRFLQRYGDYTPQQLLDLVTSQSTGGRNQWVNQLVDSPFDLRQPPYPGY